MDDAPTPGRKTPGRKTNETRRRRMVTIADIARLAGVSVPTASKVVNGRDTVSDELRKRVEHVARTQGYLPRRRAPGPSRLLELVFHRLESPWALEIVRGVQRQARRAGYGVVVSEAFDGQAPNLGWLDAVASRRSAAVISVSADLSRSHRDRLATLRVPLIAVDPAGEPDPDVPSVGAANRSGGYSAARHLIELRHRRIAVIAGPRHLHCARARLDGYRAAMSDAGLPIRGLTRSGDFLVTEGHRQGHDLLAGPMPPTAVVTGNDLQALGVYRAATDHGLHIPHDLSIVGFDDLEVADWSNPPLTTVHQPLAAMAAAAVDLALRLVEGRQPPLTRIELPTELVVRGSTAAPPTDA
jgi:LacI family transcriptional regulator, xylobiose transport system transcriptional regulator